MWILIETFTILLLLSGMVLSSLGPYELKNQLKATTRRQEVLLQGRKETNVLHFHFMVGCRYTIINSMHLVIPFFSELSHLKFTQFWLETWFNVDVLWLYLICICSSLSWTLQTLTDTLYKEIGGDSLKLSSKVLSLSCKYGESCPSSSWAISLGAKDANSKDLASQSFDAVIMTVRKACCFVYYV